MTKAKPRRAAEITQTAPAPASAGNRLWIAICLWAIIAVGVGCRFAGLNWDDGAHLHPDERFLAIMTPKLVWPSTISEYFHTEIAPLNPFNHETDFFVYGQLPLLLTKTVLTLLHRDDYNEMLVPARFLSALFDTGTVLLVWLIGRRLQRPLLGLLAAALLSVTALHIQHAHFFVVDTFGTFFLTAAFLAAIGLLENQPSAHQDPSTTPQRRKFPIPRVALWVGVLWGAALACKISTAIFAIVLIIFLVGRWLMLKQCRAHGIWKSTLLTALVLFGVAFVMFRIAHPIAFRGEGGMLTLWGLLDIRPASQLPPPQFWSAMQYQAGISRGDEAPPWNLQWIGRTDYLWPARNLALWAVGWPILLMAVAGVLLMAYRLARREPVPTAFVAGAVWTMLVFFYHAGWYSKFTRYYLIITPFIALCAAWYLAEMFHRSGTADAERPAWPSARSLALFLGAGVLGLSTLWALAVTSIYLRPHTRQAATQWIRTNIPPGAVVARETAWDDELPLGGAQTVGLQSLDLQLYDADTPDKRQQLLDKLDKTEWIFISSNRVWGTVPRLPQMWPMTTAYYRALFNGQLGFEPVQEFASYPQLNFFGRHYEFPDDTVEEAITVYDHPRVVLFRKTPAYSRAAAETILYPQLLQDVTTKTFPEIRREGWKPDESKLPWLPSVR